MPLVVTSPSRSLTSLLLGPRILLGLHFRPSPRHPPEFLSHAGGRTPARLLAASFVWPLRRTRRKGRPAIGFGTARRAIRDLFPAAATLVLQRGWWEAGPADSVRVVIENRGLPSRRREGRPMSDAEFRAEVDARVSRLMGEFQQERIWVDFYRGARRVSARQVAWR